LDFRLKIFLGVLLVAAYIGLMRQRERPVSPLSNEARLSLLAFELQAECQYHSPCFYASVDGALERDPNGALEKCTTAVQQLSALRVPDNLPDRLPQRLNEFRLGLLHSATAFRNTALAKKGLPAEKRTSPGTCRTYSTINRIHRAYGLNNMMKGHYINCEVLRAMNLPASN